MNDLISRKALIAEYDRVHIGEPGKARKLIEDAPAVREWIPVSERLPDKDGEYLVRFADKGIFNAEYESKFGSFGYWFSIMWDEDADWFPYVGVTHWMPLPEPPKEES